MVHPATWIADKPRRMKKYIGVVCVTKGDSTLSCMTTATRDEDQLSFHLNKLQLLTYACLMWGYSKQKF